MVLSFVCDSSHKQKLMHLKCFSHFLGTSAWIFPFQDSSVWTTSVYVKTLGSHFGSIGGSHWNCLTQFEVELFGLGGHPSMGPWNCVAPVTYMYFVDCSESVENDISIHFKKLYISETLEPRRAASQKNFYSFLIGLEVVEFGYFVIDKSFKNSWSWSRTDTVVPFSSCSLEWFSTVVKVIWSTWWSFWSCKHQVNPSCWVLSEDKFSFSGSFSATWCRGWW